MTHAYFAVNLPGLEAVPLVARIVIEWIAGTVVDLETLTNFQQSIVYNVRTAQQKMYSANIVNSCGEAKDLLLVLSRISCCSQWTQAALQSGILDGILGAHAIERTPLRNPCEITMKIEFPTCYVRDVFFRLNDVFSYFSDTGAGPVYLPPSGKYLHVFLKGRGNLAETLSWAHIDNKFREPGGFKFISLYRKQVERMYPVDSIPWTEHFEIAETHNLLDPVATYKGKRTDVLVTGCVMDYDIATFTSALLENDICIRELKIHNEAVRLPTVFKKRQRI